jgi:hypothetical protein
MRSHMDSRPLQGNNVPPPKTGVRPAITARGRAVKERSLAEQRALMGTIGRPYH